MYMSFTTPTIDVYVPGTTLGIGNVNAGTINIGNSGSLINVAGNMSIANSVTTPFLTTGNLIISPYSENVTFTNLSATNADVINMTSNNLNVNNFLITPLNNNPTFTTVRSTSISTPTIDCVATETLTLGNQNATIINIGKTTNITNINSGTINLSEPPSLTYTTLPTFTSNQIGYSMKAIIATSVATQASATTGSTNPFSTTFTLGVGVYQLNYQYRFKTSSGTNTITSILMNNTLAIAQTGYTNNYGLIYSQQSYALTTGGFLSFNGSGIIFNNTPSNVLTPETQITYTTSTTLQYVGADTFVIVTRIA